jgi:small subunit ribosomal protein S5
MSTNLSMQTRRRQRLRYQLRQKSVGRPRLSVFRSGKHIYAQIIDDAAGRTVAAASTLDKDLKAALKTGADKDAASAVGKLIAERSKAAGVVAVVFDRGSYLYHGRVKALAEAAREGGGKPRERERERDRETGDELIDKLVTINRVAKVVKGGRRFAFAALVVVGDQKGRVGYGAGKAREVPEAIRKATERAKKTMIRVPMKEGRTLHHDIRGKFGAGDVVIRAAPAGTGIIAGGPLRAVFETLGIGDVVAKSLGSRNPHNMVKATFAALTAVTSPRAVATRRGKKVADLYGAKKEAGAEAADV